MLTSKVSNRATVLGILTAISLLAPQSTFASSTRSSTTSSAPSSKQVGVVNNYPPSRFGAGRPTSIFGLKVLSDNPTRKTVTFTWDPSPASEHVDKYALYYYSFFPTPPAYIGVGVLAAVIKTNKITTNIIVQNSASLSSNAPYGLNEIPTCLLQSQCETSPFEVQNPFDIKVWVIAHNKNGWGDNSGTTPNPDENPSNFSKLSNNQFAKLNVDDSSAYNSWGVNLKTLDPKFVAGSWPTPPQNLALNSTPATALNATPWSVPWVPDVELPTSRFGPGRPSNVTHLQLASLDANTGKLTLKWSPNPKNEKVDEYAIYYSSEFQSDVLITRVKLVAVVESTSFNGDLKPGSQDPHGIQNPNGTHHFFVEGYPDYPVWVVAHNKNGWGDNDPIAINPDQAENDYRTLSATEISKLKLPSTIHLTLDCNSTIAKKYGC